MDKDVVVMSLEKIKPKKQRPIKHRVSYFFKVDEYSVDGEFLRRWNSIREAADHYEVSYGTVERCVRGKCLITSKVGKIFLKEGDDVNKRLEDIDNYIPISDAKPAKIVIREYDLKGKLIQVYPTLSIAATHNNVQNSVIRNVTKGHPLFTIDGKIFLCEGENIENRLELIRQCNYNASMDKSVDMYTRKGRLIRHWKSVKEAAEHFGISALPIIDVCFGKQRLCKGKIFLFSGDDINERLKNK